MVQGRADFAHLKVMLGKAKDLDALVAGGLYHLERGGSADVAVKVADNLHQFCGAEPPAFTLGEEAPPSFQFHRYSHPHDGAGGNSAHGSPLPSLCSFGYCRTRWPEWQAVLHRL